MPDILSITGPIFLLIGLGYAAVRVDLFPKTGLPALGGFVLKFCLPAVLFKSLSQRSVAEVVEPRFLAAYAIGSLLAMGLGIAWARARGQDRAAAAMTGMGMACPNTVFVGFPIASQLVGNEATVALALALMVENFLLVPLVLALADSAGAAHEPFARAFGRALLNLRKNPMVLGIVAGLVAALLKLNLPPPLARAVDLLAAGSTAAALFYLGGVLVGLQVGHLLTQVAGVTLGKLVLHPMLVLAALVLVGPIAPRLQAAMLVFAGAPMLGIYPILGQKYGHQGVNAACMLVATVGSFVSLGVVIWLMQSVRLVGG